MFSARKVLDIRNLEVKKLLKLHSSIIDELKKRKIMRTKNNPVGDYTEWLVSKRLGLELANNSFAGYDAVDKDDKKYQIKGRRVTTENKSRQVSALRNYEANDFDYLVAVIFQ